MLEATRFAFMRFLRRISLSLSVTALVFFAELMTAAAVITLSELNWDRSLLPVTVPLALGVMLVAAGLVAQLTASLARRTLLNGFQTRLDHVERARAESHRHVATMIPAVSVLVGALDSQRKLTDAMLAQLVPAVEKLSREAGAAREARLPLLNTLTLVSSLARESDQRRDAARELQVRVTRIDAAHSSILHGLREMQDSLDGVADLTAAAAPRPVPARAPAVSAGEAITLAEARRLADRIMQPDSNAPVADAAELIPPVLKARLAQRPMNYDGDGYELGGN